MHDYACVIVYNKNRLILCEMHAGLTHESSAVPRWSRSYSQSGEDSRGTRTW